MVSRSDIRPVENTTSESRSGPYNLLPAFHIAEIATPNSILERIREIDRRLRHDPRLSGAVWAERLCDESVVYKRKNLPKDNCL